MLRCQSCTWAVDLHPVLQQELLLLEALLAVLLPVCALPALAFMAVLERWQRPLRASVRLALAACGLALPPQVFQGSGDSAPPPRQRWDMAKAKGLGTALELEPDLVGRRAHCPCSRAARLREASAVGLAAPVQRLEEREGQEGLATAGQRSLLS